MKSLTPASAPLSCSRSRIFMFSVADVGESTGETGDGSKDKFLSRLRDLQRVCEKKFFLCRLRKPSDEAVVLFADCLRNGWRNHTISVARACISRRTCGGLRW